MVKYSLFKPVSTGVFWLFIYFNIDFFLRLSARIPGYGAIRPTLLLVVLIAFSLYVQRDKFKDIYLSASFSAIKRLLIYLLITLPLVGWPGSALNNFPDFVKAVVFFFFTAMCVDTEKRLKIFLFVFVSCQVIRVLEPLYLNLTTGYWGDKTYLGAGEFANRLAGAPSDIINPNELGFVIATAIPFLHYLLWSGRFKFKLLYLILLPPMLYALTLTMSRGAMIALLVVGWMVFKQSDKKFLLILAVLGGMVVLWTGLNDIQKDRYLSLVDSDTTGAKTVDGRFQGMVNEFTLGFTTRPVIGNGLGTTSETKANNGFYRQAAHNLYAELIIEIGLVGFMLFLTFLKCIWDAVKALEEQINRQAKQEDSLFFKQLVMAMFAIFWMYVVYSINYYGLSIYYWYLFGGLVVSVNRIIEQNLCERLA